jgi:hypothetical protein
MQSQILSKTIPLKRLVCLNYRHSDRLAYMLHIEKVFYYEWTLL